MRSSKLTNRTAKRKIESSLGSIPAWQKVYRQLELNKISNITSYQVNGNLFIVIPIED